MNKLLLSIILLNVGIVSAKACNLSNWKSHGGITTVSASANNDAVRYEGLCSLQVTSSGQYVEAAIANTSTDTYVRFFVYATETQSDATIFSLDTLKGKLNKDTFEIGGATLPLSPKQWHLIQVQVTPTVTNLWVDDVSVNAKSFGPIGLSAAPTTLKLGSLSGSLAGSIYIDSVIVSNKQAIDAQAVKLPDGGNTLISGDATGDSQIKLGDAIKILREEKNPTANASRGVPDCDVDGKITASDAICALKIEAKNP